MGPDGVYSPIEEAKMYAYLDSTNLTWHDMQQINFTLISPKLYYGKKYNLNFSGQSILFPLMANVEKVVIGLSNSSNQLDTLTIEYEVGSTYFEGDECNDAQLIPKAIVKNISTQGNLFKVLKFH
jgi:hypothetical protein